MAIAGPMGGSPKKLNKKNFKKEKEQEKGRAFKKLTHVHFIDLHADFGAIYSKYKNVGKVLGRGHCTS
jgi:hypothetical protein